MGHGCLSAEERFVDRIVIREDGCWDWNGPHDSDGYGRFEIKNAEQQTIGAHRFSYLWLVGDISEGLVLDHLCRNVGCANPLHVEPVTVAENQRRGLNGALKTHCKQGHEYTPENTLIRSTGRRWCRECRRAHDRRMGQKRKARMWATGEVKKPRSTILEGV